MKRRKIDRNMERGLPGRSINKTKRDPVNKQKHDTD